MHRPKRATDLVPGARLGDYIITRKLAEGGMGAVFQATQSPGNRYAALKILRPEWASEPKYVRCFLEEARAVAALKHPNLVPIDFIGEQDSIVFFAMPYIESQTFDDWIQAKRRMTSAEAQWFLKQALSALQCACDAGIVHLDIKPSNFLIDAHQTVLLTDFGLAQRLAEPLSEEEKEGEVFGTPGYVAPEQISREKTDHRTDIYSLGATLYHLMVGRMPFEGATVEDVMWGQLEKPFPARPAAKAGLDQGWTSLVRKMMERNPADRFQTYEELLKAFHDVENFRYKTPKPRAASKADRSNGA